MNTTADYREDGLLIRAAEVLTDERLALFDRYNEEEHVFSEKFERKRRRLIAAVRSGRTPGKRARWSWKTVACIAVMVALLAVPVGAIPAVREVLVHAVISNPNENQTHVEYVKNYGVVLPKSEGVLGYLPNGYTLASEHSNFCTYRNNDSSDNISFFIYDPQKSSTFTALVDDILPITQTVLIGSVEGVMIRIQDSKILVWTDASHTYMILNSSLPLQEIINIAENVK